LLLQVREKVSAAHQPRYPVAFTASLSANSATFTAASANSSSPASLEDLGGVLVKEFT
jgi:hypothetical protein